MDNLLHIKVHEKYCVESSYKDKTSKKIYLRKIFVQQNILNQFRFYVLMQKKVGNSFYKRSTKKL